MRAQKLEDLDVWRLCEEICLSVKAGIANAPARKDFRFCDQILGAAEDAVSDISEGFSRFRPREFAQFLGCAITSTAEVLERTRFAHSRKYLTLDDDRTAKLVLLCVRADRALRAFASISGPSLQRTSPITLTTNRDAASKPAASAAATPPRAVGKRRADPRVKNTVKNGGGEPLGPNMENRREEPS